MSCNTTLHPFISLSLQVVRESPRIRIVRQKDVHAYRSIIIIKGAKKEDEGLYEITVKNREGEARNHITLRVTVSPQHLLFVAKFCYPLHLKGGGKRDEDAMAIMQSV